MNEILAEENPLSQDFTIKSLLKFAFPTIVMMLLMGLYTIVDTIFVARFVGTDALSALNIVCPVINLIVGLGTMLATGGSAIVARKMGAGDTVRASQDFTLIIGTGALLGVVITALGVVFIDRIILGLGASRILFPYCREYLFLLLLFTPASMMQVLFQNLIVTAGRPGIGMALGVSAGAANILFDYIFMVPLQMGIKGAALGTGIGYLIPTAAGILFFTVGNGSLHFRIIIYTQFLLTALYIGFSMGVAPVISYNYGKQDNVRLKKVFSICMRFIILVSIVIFGLAIAFGSPLVSFFSEKGTPVYEIARKGFLIFPYSFLFCGLNIFTSATFTALSNGKLSAVLSFLRTFGLILVFLLILPEFMGAAGVWLAVPIAELITMVVALSFLYQNKDKYHYA